MEHLKKTKPRILNSISSKITNKIFKIRGFKESKIINEWNGDCRRRKYQT